MKDVLDRLTWTAILHHDDGVTAEYYRRLREERKLYTTKCAACGHVSYPPRPLCPECFGDAVSWAEIGPLGTLYAFTTQARAFRFVAPDVIGVVEIAGVGRILSKVNAALDTLRIGQKVRFEPLVLSDEITVHSFTPVED